MCDCVVSIVQQSHMIGPLPESRKENKSINSGKEPSISNGDEEGSWCVKVVECDENGNKKGNTRMSFPHEEGKYKVTLSSKYMTCAKAGSSQSNQVPVLINDFFIVIPPHLI